MKTVIFTCLIGFTLNRIPVDGICIKKVSALSHESALKALISMGYSNVEVFKLI